MASTKPKERAREPQLLDDQEIRDLYAALDHARRTRPGVLSEFRTKELFLTGQGLRMVSNMAWDEIDARDWTVRASRNKGRAGIGAADRHGDRAARQEAQGIRVFVRRRQNTVLGLFQSQGRARSQGWPRYARPPDGKPMERWTFHDLRRPRAA